MITGQEELERFWDRKATVFADAFENLAWARMSGSGYDDAIREVQNCLQATLVLSDLHGRKRTLMEADRYRRSRFDDSKSPVSSLIFEEAIDDLVSREPRLENNARELSRLYNNDHVFGMALSVDRTITEHVQKKLVDIERHGGGLIQAEEVMAELTPFSRSYAANVYRTNMATSYNRGRFAQAADPEVAEIIPALEFSAMHDARTRPNHAAAHGLIAAVTDPIWASFLPPIGYQCRCAAETVSRFELESRGLLRKNGSVVRYYPSSFNRAHPDENFKVGVMGWEAA